MELELL